MALPSRTYEEEWDFESQQPIVGHSAQANIAATTFAVFLLALVAEEGEAAENAFGGVDRVQTLRWLRRLQRSDGSFGEVLAVGGLKENRKEDFVGGGKDMRYCYMAALIRWILRGDVQEGKPGWVEDIDVEALARYIGASQVRIIYPSDST
jgi:geranylgeranyl transferase type-1 subunit beta